MVKIMVYVKVEVRVKALIMVRLMVSSSGEDCC